MVLKKNSFIILFILNFCKDNANERNESLLSNCRVQFILCKDTHILQKSLYLVSGRCYHYRRFIPFFHISSPRLPYHIACACRLVAQ
ncbi:hypothetical protein DWV60_13975 [Segatella copri]|uniref:Uncharacterized protein n=1 Tax=Segatella copri TaxID=165179 RepID=A0AA92W706_9BACT|nr:hypothetical protein DWV60_13975 [Segatella copri]